MIKAKHLLALSLAAVVAIPASADSTIQFSGSITTPTCHVKVGSDKLNMGTVSTQSFTETLDDKKVSKSEEFSLTVVDENDAVCQSVSYATSNASGNFSTQPNIRITSSNGFTEEGYLKNSANGVDEENPTLALLITDADNKKINLKEPNLVSVDDKDGLIKLKAHYVALADKVEVQKFEGNLSFTVDYK